MLYLIYTGNNILNLPKSIANLDTSDIGDNLLYYDYSIKHLLKLDEKGIDKQLPEYLSSYRSFEGAVYENYLYEKLLIYMKKNPQIGQFILKGPHAKTSEAQSNSLYVNNKGQIIYRTRSIEINEFDGLIVNEKEIFFIEMTLIKSVTNLKRRLRKKKALLEVLFPDHEIKALIILCEGVSGSKQLPSYCTVWITKPFVADDVYAWLKDKNRRKRVPFLSHKADNLVGDEVLNVFPFRYYNSLGWMLRRLRAKKNSVLNMGFLKTEVCTRYIDLFTKVYLGYMDKSQFEIMYPEVPNVTDKVVVSIEKDHTGALLLTYFMQYSRKKLDNVVIKNSKATVNKKDPYGISVTEVFHSLRIMDDSYVLSIKNIHIVEKLLRSLDP
ncbi:hypothetical protein JHD50_00475 [Sulfurimonas sp. MAG313]|nr:hypothetical protein [Sulfurimonas sp. MAG313]MDF1879788.1 hypothetical protein [Sulfurimonas sp. MAG313]